MSRSLTHVNAGLVFFNSTRQSQVMESHEWNTNTDDGKRYYRANFQAGRWSILTTTQKRDPTWERLDPPPTEVWEDLRDIVWKKYQRKRCPWDRVAELDRILGRAPEAP